MTIRATGISLNKKILRPFFITILLLGVLYAWRERAFEWV